MLYDNLRTGLIYRACYMMGDDTIRHVGLGCESVLYHVARLYSYISHTTCAIAYTSNILRNQVSVSGKDSFKSLKSSSMPKEYSNKCLFLNTFSIRDYRGHSHVLLGRSRSLCQIQKDRQTVEIKPT